MSIQSLDRAISILNLFKDNRDPIGITDIAKTTGLVKTTAHGLVSTLEKNGFLQKDNKSRKYRLGFALFELSSLQMTQLEINRRAISPLQKLSNKINRVCRVAIWDRNSIIVTMIAHPYGHESTSHQFGPRLPGYCTALGKAILANMSESRQKEYLDNTELVAYTPNTIVDRKILEKELIQIRKQGYSISNKEALPNKSGLGASVFTSGNRIAGAISIGLNAEDQDADFIKSAIELLKQTAYQISFDMGCRPVENKYRFSFKNE